MEIREEYDYTLDIKVLKDGYFCQMLAVEERLVHEFKEKSLISFAQKIDWLLFFEGGLERGYLGMEAKFIRERIRTYIKNRRQEEYFYAAIYMGKPVLVGVFITYEDGKFDVTAPDAEESGVTEDESNAPAGTGGVFVW